MPRPDVSVIIPTWNRAKYIAAALESVRRQTLEAAIEVVLADDGSTDDTAAIVRQSTADWPSNRIFRYLQLSKVGVCAARNRAIAESTAPLVAFLDSDDVWLETKLEQQIARLSSESCLVHSDFRYIDSQGNFADTGPQRPNNPAQGSCLNALLAEDTVVFSSVLVQRELLCEVAATEAHGQVFDPQWTNAQDYDLLLRIARRTSFGYCSEPLTHYRTHRDQHAMSDLARVFGFHCRVQMAFAERYAKELDTDIAGKEYARRFLLERTKSLYWQRELTTVAELCQLAERLDLSNEEFRQYRRMAQLPVWLLRTKDRLDGWIRGQSRHRDERK